MIAAILKSPLTLWRKFKALLGWSKGPIPAEAVEYQPDALEIANSRLPFLARYSVFFAFLFLAGVLVWATIGKVDVIVQGNGKIVSDKQTIVMKPLELTVIKGINVQIGRASCRERV